MTADLADLRRTEAALDAEEGGAYEHAVELMAVAAEAVDARLVVDRALIETGTMQGEVAEQWRETLTRHPNPETVWSRRRGARLLGRHTADEVEGLLVEHAGRLVALLPSSTGRGLDFRAG